MGRLKERREDCQPQSRGWRTSIGRLKEKKPFIRDAHSGLHFFICSEIKLSSQ
jgi:hypothetical protein